MLLASSSAAHATERLRISLPGGRLGDAVVALGRQAGISIGVTDPALADRRVTPVSGLLSVEEALRRLLRGSGARYVVVDAQTIRIVRTPPASRVRRPRPAPTPRPAPAPPPSPLPEVAASDIVVTASKRPIRAAAFPGIVDILDGRDVAAGGLRGTDAIAARLPVLTSTHLGPGRNKLFLRGIADSSFSGPTQATVGQYLGETRVNYNMPDPDLRLYDIDRVEVLSGPHGTLYGSGSLGGIVRIVPNAPRLDAFDAAISVGASSTQHGEAGADAAAMLNLPLERDRLGLRMIAYAMSEGGYIDDLRRGRDDVNRTRILGGRMVLRLDAGDGWTADFGLTGQSIDGNDAQFADREGAPLTRRSAVQQDFASDYLLGDLVVTRDWRRFRFVSATGIVRQTLRERFDATRPGMTPTAFDQATRASFLSIENRLSRQSADGTGWLIGASFISNRLQQDRALGPPDATQRIAFVDNDVAEAAIFGEASLRLLRRVTATLGGRIAHSRLSGAAPDLPGLPGQPTIQADARRSSFVFLPSASVTATASRDLFLFARYQQGYRPGGIAITGVGISRFRRDDVVAFEAGARYGRGGGALDAALAFAYTRWSDMQADIFDFAARPMTANIGDGRIYTIDLRFGWRPLPRLSLQAGAVFNDSRVTNPEAGVVLAPDSPLPNVARLNASFAASYEASLGGFDLRLFAEGRYVGRSRLGAGALFSVEHGDWFDLGLGGRAESGRHAFTLSLTNLLDRTGNRFAFGSPHTIGDQPQITPLRPRTLRVGWDYRF